MEGWTTKALGELCEIELGKTPARANASFWDAKRETSNVWLSIADLLKAEDNVVFDSKEYVSDKGAAICNLVPKGTLLVSFKLTLGRMAFAGRDLFTNEAIAALTIFNERELSKEFLFYCLTFFDWVKAAENDVKLKGMTLNKAKLKVMPVSFPSLAEQKRIVAILDEAFEGIDKAIANTEKSLANARELFESYLQTVFGSQDGSWTEYKLGDVMQIGSSKRIYEKDWTSSGVPFYGGREIVQLAKHGEANSVNFISEEKYAEYKALYGMPQANDIMMTARGTIGTGYIVKPSDKFYYKDGNVMYLRPGPRVDPRFVLFAFRSNDIAVQCDRLTGTTVKHLSIEKAKEISIRAPALELQKSIVSQLNAVGDECRRLEAQCEFKFMKLTDLRRSLLERAFSGQLQSTSHVAEAAE